MDKKLSIGRLAEMTGVPSKTIRYYEEVGIVPPAERTESHYRMYSEVDVRRLELVRRARALDMTLLEVRELVEWAGSGTCDDFQDRFLQLVQGKLGEVDRRIVDLELLKQDIQRLEAHFMESKGEAKPDHTVLECSKGKCTCLGGTPEES